MNIRNLALSAALISSTLASTAFAEAPRNWLFIGGNVGYLGTTTTRALEVEKSGIEGAIKLIGSHYFDKVVVDLGAGYAYSHIQGEGFGLTKNIKVITRSFIAEFSPRYRWGANWQVGPVLQYLNGEDVSYDESGTINEMKSLWRLGARVQYELGDAHRWRIGAQAVTDLNIENRNIVGLALDVQFGFSPGYRPAAQPSAVAATVVPTRPQFAEVKDQTIRIYLGEAMLSFPSGGSKLNSKAKEALAKLAPVLSRNESSWTRLRIEGHTDARIGKNDNQALSQKRAEAVRKEFVALHLPEKKITSKGFGAKQPIDPENSEEAFLLNRRVEIWLDDVKEDQIPKIMTELKQLQ